MKKVRIHKRENHWACSRECTSQGSKPGQIGESGLPKPILEYIYILIMIVTYDDIFSMILQYFQNITKIENIARIS